MIVVGTLYITIYVFLALYIMTSKRRIKHLLELANEASNKDDIINNITHKKKK